MSHEFMHGEEYLIASTINHLKITYALTDKNIFINQPITRELEWRPSFYIKKNRFSIIAFEVSEHPLPTILKIRYADIQKLHVPITIVSVCHDDNTISTEQKKEIKELRELGFGLITVNSNGDIEKVNEGIPLIQYISESEFADESKDLPKAIRQRLRDCYESYTSNPMAGLNEITELTELIVNNVVKQMIRKGWLANNVESQSLNYKLTEMVRNCTQCNNARASIGSLMGYISKYRNASHHAPTTQKELYNKIFNCQHGFRDGIRQLKHFNQQMKHIGISLRAT